MLGGSSLLALGNPFIEMRNPAAESGEIFFLALFEPDLARSQIVEHRLELVPLLTPQLFTHTRPRGRGFTTREGLAKLN